MGKTVEIPQVGETLTGAQRSVTLQLETVRQQAPAEIVEITEQGPPLPAERAPDVFVAPQAPATTVVAEPVFMAAPAPVTTFAAPPVMVAEPVTTVAAPQTFAAPPVMVAEPVMTYTAPQPVMTTVAAPQMMVEPIATYAAQPMTVAPAMTTMALPTTYGTTGDLFSTLDRNHDGVLTRSEFNRMY